MEAQTNRINTVFSELLKHLPIHRFEKAVSVSNGDRYTERFTAWNQLATLLYAQISCKESLREIETGLARPTASGCTTSA